MCGCEGVTEGVEGEDEEDRDRARREETTAPCLRLFLNFHLSFLKTGFIF